MRKLATIAGPLAVAALMIPLSLPAAAATTTPRDDWAAVREFMTEYDVPADVQDTLIADFEAGERWDSLSSDSVPVATESARDDRAETVVNRYADGSVAVLETSLPESRGEAELRKRSGDIGTQAISQCSSRYVNAYQTDYVNCWVDGNMGVTRMHFRFDYSRFNGATRMNRAYNPGYFYSVGEPGTPNVRVTRTNSTSTLPSVSRMDIYVDLPYPAGGYNSWIEARASAGGALSDAWYM